MLLVILGFFFSSSFAGAYAGEFYSLLNSMTGRGAALASDRADVRHLDMEDPKVLVAVKKMLANARPPQKIFIFDSLPMHMLQQFRSELLDLVVRRRGSGSGGNTGGGNSGGGNTGGGSSGGGGSGGGGGSSGGNGMLGKNNGGSGGGGSGGGGGGGGDGPGGIRSGKRRQLFKKMASSFDVTMLGEMNMNHDLTAGTLMGESEEEEEIGSGSGSRGRRSSVRKNKSPSTSLPSSPAAAGGRGRTASAATFSEMSSHLPSFDATHSFADVASAPSSPNASPRRKTRRMDSAATSSSSSSFRSPPREHPTHPRSVTPTQPLTPLTPPRGSLRQRSHHHHSSTFPTLSVAIRKKALRILCKANLATSDDLLLLVCDPHLDPDLRSEAVRMCGLHAAEYDTEPLRRKLDELCSLTSIGKIDDRLRAAAAVSLLRMTDWQHTNAHVVLYVHFFFFLILMVHCNFKKNFIFFFSFFCFVEYNTSTTRSRLV